MQAASAKGVSILLALAVTISVGIAGNPNLSGLERPSWQPSNAAFSIWALIYAGIAAGGALQLVPAVAERTNPWLAALLCASLVSSTGWLVSVRRALDLSAVLIVIAFLMALAALASNPPLRDPSNLADRAVALGPALLAGWLSLAAPLGVSLAVQERSGKELPGWSALPTALAAAAVGGASGTPEVGAVLVWAAIFSARSAPSNTIGIVGIVSAIAAVARSLSERART